MSVAIPGIPVSGRRRPDSPSMSPAVAAFNARQRPASHNFLGTLRFLLLDVPLTIVLGTLLSTYAIRNLYHDVYEPLIDRATRTNLDLEDELTYYHRYCTQADVSTREIANLVADAEAPVQVAVQQMMEHGAVVIRDILSPDTVRALRAYTVQRNEGVLDEEVYPVSQGHKRLSFGYDATDSPILAAALQEIANNQFLKDLLSQTLGDEDPASSEITTITAYYGAGPQGWHSDTKEDGNALKFARTYSHSYSLFLPLQNTTKEMGMTDICPGTHYCANDLSSMCDSAKMSLAKAAGNHFKAGDGALLNQILWHRGGAHRDKENPERIVFIVSFLARPDMVNDPRQLSRGTYFHQKWNMWGHTWKDLMDPMLSMQKPFSYLRCLSLWKPPSHSWGYDLITSGFMRFSNGQMEGGEIQARLWPRLDQMHFPEWLRSDLPEEDEWGQKASWKYFLEGTIDRTLAFLKEVVLKMHAIYFVGALLVGGASLVRNKGSIGDVFRPIRRVMTLHLVVILGVFYIWYHIRHSEWGVAVLKGQALMRPFPTATLTTSEELAFISQGPTTFPANNDALLGTRYHAKFLGMYEDYIDWHTGNRPYLRAVQARAPLYEAYQRSASDFDARIVYDVRHSVTKSKGRFLEQDYRTGDWRIMSDEEIEVAIRRDLMFEASPARRALRPLFRRMIALGRFGFGRETVLMRKSVVYLLLLEARLAEVRVDVSPVEEPYTVDAFRLRESVGAPESMARMKHTPAFRLGPFSSADQDEEPFPVGSTVYVDGKGRFATKGWDRGHVMRVDDEGGTYSLALESGARRDNVPRKKIHPYNPVTEGDHIEGCFEEDLKDCWPGTVLRVMPDASIAVSFDDGDVSFHHGSFFTPPYKYIPPE